MAKTTVPKASITSTFSDINGMLAWARESVRTGDWEQVLTQLEGVRVLVALAKVRVEQRQREEEA